jgi:16S rRNA processing protein RimM
MVNDGSTSGLLAVAHLLRPQGRRGELLADPLTDLPGLFTAGREAALPSGEILRIEDHWFPTRKNAGRIVLKLSGCDSISQAEALAGLQLLIPTADLPTLDPGTYFVADLIGCTLFDGQTPVGTIVALEFPTTPDGRRLDSAPPLLAVQPLQPEAAEHTLVPFVRAWLDSVDTPGHRIVMHLPPGLFGDL